MLPAALNLSLWSSLPSTLLERISGPMVYSRLFKEKYLKK